MTANTVRKNITIRRDQEEWLKKNPVNLSHAVQDMLDKMMKKVKYI